MSVDRETLAKRIFGTGSRDLRKGDRTSRQISSIEGPNTPSFDDLYSSSSPNAVPSTSSSPSLIHGATKEDEKGANDGDTGDRPDQQLNGGTSPTDVSAPIAQDSATHSDSMKASTNRAASPQSVDHLPDEEEEAETGSGSATASGSGSAAASGAGTHTDEDQTNATAPDIGSKKSTNTKYKDDTTIKSDSIRYKRFQEALKANPVDLEHLKKLAWNGVPPEFRPKVWQLLLGYHPVRSDRAARTIDRKRKEYWQCVNQYMVDGEPQMDLDTSQIRSVLMDIPRTAPGIPIMHTEKLQKCLERILYIWARRHPASGYVQGINDLASAFFVVFLTPVVNLDSTDLSQLPQDTLDNIEADVFWCLNKMVDRIQDHYTPSQPGIQRMISSLRELCNRLDRKCG
eukprot:gb/GECG01008243.1/.p1 GENE.gb/GECG01008243.1/~~gb/GECG01008243.1/.p1  ORF type:complete len:400 (+),score=55.71 gb/GECG01008243.1/:1-1200(+)